MLVNTNDGSPALSRTLKFDDKDKTKEIVENTESPVLSKTLEFKEDNYKIVPITPATSQAVESEKEKIKVIPAGGTEEVEVTVSKNMGKMKTASKLPVAKLLTHQKLNLRRGRSISLSDSQKERKKKFEELAKQRPKMSEPIKRTEPESAREEESSKVSRVISPEKTKSSEEDNTKAEDVTASSDDLSSISVLECGSVEVNTADTDTEVVVESEVNIEKEIEDGEGDMTADNTVIKVEVNSQPAETETQQSTQPPPQAGDEPLKEVVKEAVTADTGAAATEEKTKTDKVQIVMEPGLVWDKSTVPSPEEKKSPGDKTGHIVGVRAHTPHLNVDSNVDNTSLMKKFTEPLKLAFKEDEKKNEEDENLD